MGIKRTPFKAYSQIKKRRMNKVRNIFIKTLVVNDFLDNIPEPSMKQNLKDRVSIEKSLWVQINKENIKRDYY